MRIQRRLPLKWSALRYAIREMRTDVSLRFSAGLKRYRRNLQEEARAQTSSHLLQQVLHLDGDVIECGVYRGDSLLRFAMTVSQSAPHKTVYGLDSFRGFPPQTVRAGDVGQGRTQRRVQHKFKFAEHAPTRIRRICDLLGIEVELVPGFFHDTLPFFENHQFCFVHLDCDLYDSYVTCLSALYDRVTPGGLIVFDEYNSRNWPGATSAIDEFFAEKPEELQFLWTGGRENYFVRKTLPSPDSQRVSTGSASASVGNRQKTGSRL